jgi:transcription antitermination factor NusG
MREAANMQGATERQAANLAAADFEPHWYAAHTSARHERRVAEQLTGRSVEHYLAEYESVRRWKDRRVRLSLPLFPGYVFVRIPLCERLRVLTVPGVARLVGFNGRPAPLPSEEIEKLRQGLSVLEPRPHPFLTAGDRVQIVDGPLEGMEGILLRRKGLFRVVLSLDLIKSSICVDVEADSVRPLPSSRIRSRNQ